MRKLLYISAFAAAAVAAVACVRDLTDENNGVEPDQTLNGPVFTAEFEGVVATRTSVSDGEDNVKIVNWENDDVIAIYYKDSEGTLCSTTASIVKNENTSATFQAKDEIPSGTGQFWAVYPSTIENVSVAADGTLSLNIPTNVASTFRQANICAAVTTGDEMSFSFRNVTAIAKFTLPTENLSYIQMVNMSGYPIRGDINITLGDESVTVAAGSSTAYNVQTTPVSDEGGVFYVSVIPGTYSKGLAFNIVYSGKTLPAVFAEKEIVFERGHILNFGEVHGRQITDWYFTASGKGSRSGTSWENAGDAETFKTLFGAKTEKVDKYMQIWRTTGTTCHFGAGTYYLADSDANPLTVDFDGANGKVVSNFKWIGGYPSDGGDTSDPSSNQTVFSGNEGKTAPILSLVNRACLNVEGITFKDGKVIGDGAAIKINSDGCTHHISDCRFENNVATACGGALKIFAGNVRINNCYFGKNEASGNTSGNKGHGGAIFSEGKSKATIFLNACVFDENINKSSSYSRGNAFCGLGTDKFYAFNNCTVKLCETADLYGAIYLAQPYIMANSSMLGNPHYKYGLLSDGNATAVGNLINNVIINLSTSGNRPGVACAAVKSYGSNVVSKYTKFNGSAVVDNSDNIMDSDYTGSQYIDSNTDNMALKTLGGLNETVVDSWDASAGGWIWNGTVTATEADPWSGMTASGFASALRSITATDSEDTVTSYGSEFYTWLESIGATDTDVLGNKRTEPWWPGAYQKSN